MTVWYAIKASWNSMVRSTFAPLEVGTYSRSLPYRVQPLTINGSVVTSGRQIGAPVVAARFVARLRFMWSFHVAGPLRLLPTMIVAAADGLSKE